MFAARALNLKTTTTPSTPTSKCRNTVSPNRINRIIQGHYQKYQTLHFEDALQIALSESLHLYNSRKEEEDLELAIQMSTACQEHNNSDRSGNIPEKVENVDKILVQMSRRFSGIYTHRGAT